MNPDQIEAERARFEAWWYGRYGSKIAPPVAYFQFLGNGYLNERIEGQWQGWLAAKQDAKEQA